MPRHLLGWILACELLQLAESAGGVGKDPVLGHDKEGADHVADSAAGGNVARVLEDLAKQENSPCTTKGRQCGCFNGRPWSIAL